MVLKRIIDIVAAAVGLLLVVPLIGLVALVLWLRGRGMALQAVPRLGRHGRQFRMYRLRLAPAGPAPRRFSTAALANLPQLLNVLKGDMSLLGPRPLAPELLRRSRPLWRQVLAVRPGMLSLSQVMLSVERGSSGREAAPFEPGALSHILPVQLHLDLYYVEHCSLLLDLQLLGMAMLLLARPGQYATVA